MSEDQKQNEMDSLISDDMWVYGYTQIDNGVIYCKQITDSEFRTYCVVRSLVNQRKAVAWPSFDTIAELSGHHKRTAQRNVARLEELDLIKKIPRNGISNQFIVKKLQNSSVLKDDERIEEYIIKHGLGEEQPKPQKKNGSDIEQQGKADPIPYKVILDHLNNQAGTKFNHKGQANQKQIKARWNEGNSLEDFIHVIDTKVAQWKGTTMDQYLRPSTLFGNKFDQYKNEQPIAKSFGQTGQPAKDDWKQRFLEGDDE